MCRGHGVCVGILRSHILEEYSGSPRRSTTYGHSQANSQEGCVSRKPRSSSSAPPTPRPIPPSGTGVHEGASRTGKPAFHRSSASACNVVAGAEPGDETRAARVSRSASESDAAIVSDRRTVSRAEPRSRSESARISPRTSRRPSAGSSVSTTEHRTFSGKTGSVGAGGTSSEHFHENFAENSTRPAVRVAIVQAGSLVGSTAVSRLSARRRPRVPPASLSAPPVAPAWRSPAPLRGPPPEPYRRPPQSRRTADEGATVGS